MKSFFKTALFLILTGAFLPMAIYADNPTPTPQAPASQTQYVIPKLGIEIPGVVFTTPTEAGTDIRVPFLMEYVNGVYRFAITLGMLASIIVIMWGGFLYLAGSTIGSVEKGKKKIVDAIAGFAILLGATAILNTVSPLSARLQDVTIQPIQSETGEGEGSNEPIVDGNTARSTPSASGAPESIPASNIVQISPFRQFERPWGPVGYGVNLTNGKPLCDQSSDPRVSAGECNYFCANMREQTSVRGCIGTFQQGACGVTSLASALSAFGATYEGHPVTPLDTAKYAVTSGFRPPNSGTSPDAFKAPNIASAFPGFSSTQTRDPGMVATAIKNCYPVVFLCAQCSVIKGDGTAGSGSGGGGHYMLLAGVSASGNTFLIHDVGHNVNTGAKFITAENLRGSSMWIIHPANANPLTTRSTLSTCGQ